MSLSRVTYSNVVVKQRIESWGEGLDFDPEEQLLMLLEDKFGVKDVNVVESREEADCMMMTVASDAWIGEREFALLRTGSLVW